MSTDKPVVLPTKFQLRPIEFDSTTWLIDLDKVPHPVTFADVSRTEFWQHHGAGSSKIKRGDFLRVLGQGGSFDVMLVCVATYSGGISVETWPRYPTGGAR